jgi:hypothetical protein
MKTYLRITPDGKDEWVDTPAKATSDYHGAAMVTQERLKQAGSNTTLVMTADTRLMQPKWVICKEDVGARPGYGRGKVSMSHSSRSPTTRRKKSPPKTNTKLRYK